MALPRFHLLFSEKGEEPLGFNPPLYLRSLQEYTSFPTEARQGPMGRQQRKDSFLLAPVKYHEDLDFHPDHSVILSAKATL